MKQAIVLPISLLGFVSLGVAASDDSGIVPRDSGPLLETIRPAKKDIQRLRTDIRIDTDMTLVPVTVTDEHGRNVLGLGKNNFRVLDGQEVRPIVTFSREDAPVSVVLVFNASQHAGQVHRGAGRCFAFVPAIESTRCYGMTGLPIWATSKMRWYSPDPTAQRRSMLGFYPPNDAPSGKYRRIKVELLVSQGMPPMNVYARSGYYTPQR